jgi:glycosyltransferase involved in cell wall biosynthesis
LESQLRAASVPVHVIGKHTTADPLAWVKLLRTLRQIEPDIVHTWIFAANAYGRYAALWAKVPCIVGSERSVDPWKGTWQLTIDRYLAKRTHGISTNSPGVVDFYHEQGIDRSNFKIIPNGIELRDPRLEISRQEAFERLGIPLNHRLILSIGRLWHQKGYKDLIWAAEMLRILRSEVSYVILGEGPERQRLEAYRDNVRAAASVHLIGHRPDAMQILPHADLLWNGSLYEGQSNVILEAMQAGVPVLATDIPGNRDLIENEKTGILFPVGDVDRLMRISNQLLDDSQWRVRLIESAREHVAREHSASTMIQRHEAWYRQLLQR